MAVEGSGVCDSCPNKAKGCHPGLKPEKLAWVGFGTRAVEMDDQDSSVECRHFTCASDGSNARGAAQRQLAKGKGETYQVVGFDWQPRDVRGVKFHSGTKFTRGGNARMVADDGRVYSMQDGVFYPTGQ